MFSILWTCLHGDTLINDSWGLALAVPHGRDSISSLYLLFFHVEVKFVVGLVQLFSNPVARCVLEHLK